VVDAVVLSCLNKRVIQPDDFTVSLGDVCSLTPDARKKFLLQYEERKATELRKRYNGQTVYILDEPTTGLHFEDIRRLLDVLHRLVDKGNTVIVIEHNLDVIKTADHLIDLGPEGGDGGGTIVAAGTPEEVAAAPSSYTGKFLRELLSA
jgi:excinuclease UvrABC ATPase subunit